MKIKKNSKLLKELLKTLSIILENKYTELKVEFDNLALPSILINHLYQYGGMLEVSKMYKQHYKQALKIKNKQDIINETLVNIGVMLKWK